MFEVESKDYPHCGLRTADCGLRTADCGLRIADCGLRVRRRPAIARYWTRNATIGSTRVARRAGIRLARNPAVASNIETPANTIGSSGLTS
jgi:hypothetical protein